MKLAVTRCDGDTEIIVLRDPVKVYEGTSQAHIQSAEEGWITTSGCLTGTMTVGRGDHLEDARKSRRRPTLGRCNASAG